MRIAVDAMGGDNAPDEIVRGAASASLENDGEILLVGDSEKIAGILAECDYNKERLCVIHASEIITNDDKPTVAIRKKPDSSLVRCFNLIKEGEADGMVSAGSTGALLAGSVHFLKRIDGVSRPALAPFLPSATDGFLIVDGGANTNSRPENLLQFGIMGSIYCEKVMGRKSPKVGLLNIGAEDSKGTELTKEAFELLKNTELNFIGNVEGRDPAFGACDVVVCDGFAGNVLLKSTEGAAGVVFNSFKSVFKSNALSKISALMLKKELLKLKKKFDYTEYGGAPFLGVRSCVVKAHGTSNARSVAGAIKQANSFAESHALEEMEEQINKYKGGAESDI